MLLNVLGFLECLVFAICACLKYANYLYHYIMTWFWYLIVLGIPNVVHITINNICTWPQMVYQQCSCCSIILIAFLHECSNIYKIRTFNDCLNDTSCDWCILLYTHNVMFVIDITVFAIFLSCALWNTVYEGMLPSTANYIANYTVNYIAN